jgi:hypothetical protein
MEPGCFDTIALQQMDRESCCQRIAKEPPTRTASFQFCFQGHADMLYLWISAAVLLCKGDSLRVGDFRVGTGNQQWVERDVQNFPSLEPTLLKEGTSRVDAYIARYQFPALEAPLGAPFQSHWTKLESEQVLLSIGFRYLPSGEVSVMLDNKTFPIGMYAGENHRRLRSSGHRLTAPSVYQ